jgi:hypothetical protein
MPRRYSPDELLRMGFVWRAGDYPLLSAKIRAMRDHKRKDKERGIKRSGVFVSAEILSAAERGLAMTETKQADTPKESALLTAMDKRLIEILQLLKNGMEFSQAAETQTQTEGLTQAEQSRLASILLSI